MFSIFFPYLFISTWSFSRFSHLFNYENIVKVNWDNAPKYAIDLFEHLPDHLIGNVAALNLTEAPPFIQEHFHNQLKEIETVLAYIHPEDLPKNVLEWIKNHPQESIIIIIDVGIFIAPWLFILVILGFNILVILGFSRLGPIAGSAAAIAQRAIGKLEARGFFSILQSAAMKGYGKVILKRIARSAAALGGAILAWILGNEHGRGGEEHSNSVATLVAKAVADNSYKAN